MLAEREMTDYDDRKGIRDERLFESETERLFSEVISGQNCRSKVDASRAVKCMRAFLWT